MRFPLPNTPAAQAGQAFRPPAPPARAERSLHLADAGTAAGACGARVDGKFFRRADERVYLAGVTYGPFAPGAQGEPYHPQRTAEDFAGIAAAGFNSVRLYTPPPLWLLDLAVEHGLGVLAGTAWEQHVTFLDDRRRAAAIAARVAGDIRARAGHAALLGWAIGNEIPAPIVRWHGPGRIRAFLERLYVQAKEADPVTAVTYVNYPTTEYLELDFLDFVCFNVFLERPRPYESYLHRLQNLAGDRPLLLTEIGLDSGRHGEPAQAETLEWQVQAALAAGSAGAFVFSWTDEWHRGGAEITNWHFGLTDRQRRPRPALTKVSRAFARAPLRLPPDPPRISVLVCTYNGARTLPAACDAIAALDYPAVEVIVVDDGSTDGSAAIARGHGFRVISTQNRGLSSARNTALSAAGGDIVAYIDDDAMPDPQWLTYLADIFARTEFVAVGGPNLPVPGDGAVADAVAVSPGNPVHVLITDRDAEHIPGCNSAFRTRELREIGGFDEQFHTAGDDVDVCWRLQDRGWKIGYCAAAVVWHHRRRSVREYLRQQRGYGHAEALLERKWPARYSAGGHITWRGRVYGEGAPRHATGRLRWRVYHGTWGTAPFQSLYEPARGDPNVLLLMPELYLGIGALVLLVALGALWRPLLALAPVLVVMAGVLALRAAGAARRARFTTPGLAPTDVALRRALTALLHVLQPLVRLQGRLLHGLTPWRRLPARERRWPRTVRVERWTERWIDPVDWVQRLERGVLAAGAVVRRGGDFDSWDVETRGGVLAGTRVSTVVEEHGAGRQLARFSCRPALSRAAVATALALLVLAALAAVDGAVAAAVVLCLLGFALALRIGQEAAVALGLTARVAREFEP